MANTTETVRTIDDSLRFVLYGISLILDIDLRAAEIERVFSDRTHESCAKHSYEFHSSPRIRVTGRIEEYEGETVRLSVTAPEFTQELLNRIEETANHASFEGWARRRQM